MTRPTVHQARRICESLKARAVIILALSEDGVAGASYGQTKLECKQTAYTLEVIMEGLEEGDIPVWATSDTGMMIAPRIIRDEPEEVE